MVPLMEDDNDLVEPLDLREHRASRWSVCYKLVRYWLGLSVEKYIDR